MKKLIALILAMVMSISMVACGGGEEETPKSTIDKILDKGYITVAISPDFAPSEFKDPISGEVLGTDVEYAKYVAQYISEKYGKTVELKIEEMDFKSCQAAVATGTVDFSVNGYAATAERQENYICAGPYAVVSAENDTYHGALVKKGLKIETAEDFKGLKIGAQQASLQYNLAMEQLPIDEMPEIELITTLPLGAIQVATDKIDALITDSGAAESIIHNNPELEMAAFKFEYSSEGNVALVNLNETELGALITEALVASGDVMDYDTLRNEMAQKAIEMGVEVLG
ncbi:MAG: amino acid ABC transporter substrate-binding protein [Oscillospiraceae bacterium]|nr:amino acid ABC transporter substrate-binding protein [Oscillospiraceae bacterium]